MAKRLAVHPLPPSLSPSLSLSLFPFCPPDDLTSVSSEASARSLRHNHSRAAASTATLNRSDSDDNDDGGGERYTDDFEDASSGGIVEEEEGVSTAIDTEIVTEGEGEEGEQSAAVSSGGKPNGLHERVVSADAFFHDEDSAPSVATHTDDGDVARSRSDRKSPAATREASATPHYSSDFESEFASAASSGSTAGSTHQRAISSAVSTASTAPAPHRARGSRGAAGSSVSGGPGDSASPPASHRRSQGRRRHRHRSTHGRSATGSESDSRVHSDTSGARARRHGRRGGGGYSSAGSGSWDSGDDGAWSEDRWATRRRERDERVSRGHHGHHHDHHHDHHHGHRGRRRRHHWRGADDEFYSSEQGGKRVDALRATAHALRSSLSLLPDTLDESQSACVRVR